MRPSGRKHEGFTLLELLVVVALLAMLAAMVWPVLSSDSPRGRLERSAERMASLLAMCRAQAMLNGRTYRLTWPGLSDSSSGNESEQESNDVVLQPIVEWETDSPDSSSQFEAVSAAWANEPVLASDITCWIVQVGQLDYSKLEQTNGRFELPAEPALATVSFYPDGTSDDAVFVLGPQEQAECDECEEESLQCWVVLDGTTGTASVRWPPSEEQLQALLEQQASLLDMKFQETQVGTGMLGGLGGGGREDSSGSPDVDGMFQDLIGTGR